MCPMALKSSPLYHVLVHFGAATAPHQCPFPCPITLSPLSLTHTWSGAMSHCRCMHSIPSASPAHPRPLAARKGCSEATRHQHRAQASKAHPPPLIRLRSESTSSAPSMATSSCRERRNLGWKPLLCSTKALLFVQLRIQAAARNDARAGTTLMPA